MTNELSFTDIEVQVEDYAFLITHAYKTSGSERFSLQIKNRFMCFLNAYEDKFEFFLLPNISNTDNDKSLVCSLGERKDFLIKLYNAIRNHPSIRLRMLNTLGPMKQY